MKKILVFDAKKCTGCKTCEMACSLYQTGACNPLSSRRRSIHLDREVLDVPMQCFQCEDAACMANCPQKAIFVDEETNAKVIDYERCIGCTMCMFVCPFGAVVVDPATNRVAKCDLCGGSPACAKICPTGAIHYVTPDRFGFEQQQSAIERFACMVSGLPEVAANGPRDH